MVKVSIVMPMFNQEKYIVECLSSVLRQTLQEIEIIVVNDGSTDNSLALVKEFAQRDDRIVIIDKPNSGYGHSMNVGMDRASGEYIGIVETDDYVDEEMFAALYDAAKQNGDADVVKSDFYRFSSEQGFLSRKLVKLSEKKEYYNRPLCPLQEREVFRFPMNTWTGIYRREFLQKYGIRHNETPGASYQDNGFWFQTFCFARTAVFVNRAFYMNRRDNPNSSVYNPGKVYCVCEEYAYIARILDGFPQIKEKIIGYYWLKKYHNYTFTLQRIAYMYKKEFALRMQKEFAEGERLGQLEKDLFTEKDRADIALLLSDPERFLESIDMAVGEAPVISVIVVKTNEFFQATFESIANQRFAKLQIICAGRSFTERELELIGRDERAVVFMREASFPDLIVQAMSMVQGEFLHILSSGTILDSLLYASAVKNMASSLSDAYICGADIRFSDKYVRSDQHNFNTDFLLSGTVSPHENSAFLFAVGPSLNNKVFRFSAMDQTGEGLLSYDEKGDSPCFVLKSVAACRFVCYESEALIKRTYAPVAKDFSALLEEYEKCLPVLQGKEWARTSFVNCLANEVYNWFASGREGALFALKNEERIKKILSLPRCSREQFFNGYVYDFLLSVLYSALPEGERLAAACEYFKETEEFFRAECPYAGGKSTSAAAIPETLRHQLKELIAARNSIAGDYRAITRSVSFRVGRMITFLPRKLRDLLRQDGGKNHRKVLKKKLARADKKGLAIAAETNPLVSIVMPLYNVAKYIEECLDSLFNQTYKNIEIICVDDGSQDNTCQIVERYAKDHPNLYLYRQEHLFAGVARNTGFEHAKGKYTIFLDSDDFFETDFVRSMVARAEGTGAEIVACRCRGFDNVSGKFFAMNWSVHDEWLPQVPVFSGRGTGKYFFFAFMGWAWDKMYRTEFVRKHRLAFQDLRSSNDAYFTFTSLALARKVSFVDKILINQRRNLKTSISNTRSKSWNNCLLAADKIYTDWKKMGLYRGKADQAFCNWFIQFVCWHYFTLDEEARAKLAAELPQYAEKYKLFSHGPKYYYMQMDYEHFKSLIG